MESLTHTDEQPMQPIAQGAEPEPERKAEVDPSESMPQVILALAQLTQLEYERRRTDAAERFDIRVSVLDDLVKQTRPAKGAGSGFGKGFRFIDPAPCADTVPTDALLEKTVATLKRYLVLPEHADTAIALWVLHTWALDAFGISPLLVIQSPQKRCGKSTLLMLLAALARRPLPNANASPSVLFRIVDAHEPTLLLDEADTWLRDNVELRGIINAGHTRKTAYTMRSIRNTSDEFEPRQFSTWCAKAIAGIGSLRDTIEDRSIIVRMRRRAPGENVERLRHDRIAVPEASMFARWQQDNLDALRIADPHVPSTLNDRAADNWRPLLAIADLAGGKWPNVARQAAIALSDVHDDEGAPSTALLTDIRVIFAQHGDRLSTACILAGLLSIEDRPWREVNRGRQVTSHWLSRMLKPFGIGPRNLRLPDGILKGYAAEDFQDAFNRYLAPGKAATLLQRSNGAGSGGFQTATRKNGVADSDRLQAARLSPCSAVAASECGGPDDRAAAIHLANQRAGA